MVHKKNWPILAFYIGMTVLVNAYMIGFMVALEGLEYQSLLPNFVINNFMVFLCWVMLIQAGLDAERKARIKRELECQNLKKIPCRGKVIND